MKTIVTTHRASLRGRIMMAFMLVIITWGVVLTILVNRVFESILVRQGLPAEAIATVTSRFLLVCSGTSLAGLAVFYFFANYLAQTLCGPLQTLMTGVEELGAGNMDARVQINGEDEMGDLAAAFNRMAEKVGELDRLKSEFISTVSHELRTPMASILGFSELLLEEELSEEQRQESLVIIARKSQELHGLIEGLLDLSRLEAGCALVLDCELFDLKQLVAELLDRYRQEKQQHQFVLMSPDGPLLLEGDRLRLERVLDNLLSNAVKYSPAGGSIIIEYSLRDREVVVRIRDEGIGMTQEQVQRAFERFYRVDGSNTAVRGVGLGLSIVRQVVEAHGGTICIESRVGEGTTAMFTLPLVRPGQRAFFP